MSTNTVYCEKCGQEVGGVDQWIAISRADDEKIAALTEERNKYKDRLLEINRWLGDVESMLGGTEVDVKRARKAISETITGKKSPE